MASGLGPNLILPWGTNIFAGLGGFDPTGRAGNATGMFGFGVDPMQVAGGTMRMGQLGGLTSYGPQGMNYQRPGFALGDPAGAGLNAALFGHTYNPAFGQSAYERFGDAGDSYLRRYGTNLVVKDGQIQQPFLDAQGNQVGYGQGGVRANPAYSDPNNMVGESPEAASGRRSIATLGGFTREGNAYTGQSSPLHREFAGLLQLQQGANPFLNDPATAANMAIFSELSSPFSRMGPQQYLDAARSAETGPTTGALTDQYIPQMGGMTGGMYSGVTGDVGRMTNAYEQDLMSQIAAQGSKDLSLGLQDAQSTMASMGLGRSGQAQSTALGAWKDIQESNALQRQNLMAQFRESAMGREAAVKQAMGQSALSANSQAILQAQQAAAQANEARLQRMNAAAMGGMQGLAGSLEASRAAQRGALQQGMQNTLGWNQGVQDQYLRSLLGNDQAMLNRQNAQASMQSAGMRDYMLLQQTKDQMRQERLNEMLGLEDRYRTSQNEVLNQMAQYGMMPLQYLMQGITGISPTGGGPARTSPWPTLLGGAGLNLATQYLGQMGQPSRPGAYSNSYQLEPANG